MAGVCMSAPPWYVMGGVTTPVPPVVSAAPTRAPLLVSGPLSGRLSGLTRWATGPLSFWACAVLSSCEARNRQTAARTARVMLKVLFILSPYEVMRFGREAQNLLALFCR